MNSHHLPEDRDNVPLRYGAAAIRLNLEAYDHFGAPHPVAERHRYKPLRFAAARSGLHRREKAATSAVRRLRCGAIAALTAARL
jgi:hypothetical protein